MEDEDMVKASTDSLVTETTLDPTIPADMIVAALRKRKTTGQLTFHISQGGLQKVALTEKTKADDCQSERIREILDMD
jgi:hypothetical protein